MILKFIGLCVVVYFAIWMTLLGFGMCLGAQ